MCSARKKGGIESKKDNTLKLGGNTTGKAKKKDPLAVKKDR